MMRIGIIGASSFLAKNFIEYSRNTHEYEFQLYYHVTPEEHTEYQYEVVNYNDVDDICKKVDFDADRIMIFIGKTGTVNGFSEYEEFLKVNELYLLNILTAYVKCKSKARIIYPSSRLIYKSSSELINENSNVDLRSIYAVTKYASEKYLEIYKQCYEVDYVTLHICTPIGTLLESNGTYGTFKIFEDQAQEKGVIELFGDGLQKKTFTDINDICIAFDKLIRADNTNYNTYNLGGQILTLREICEKIADKHKVKIKNMEWPKLYKEVDGGSVAFDSERFDSEFHMKYSKLI